MKWKNKEHEFDQLINDVKNGNEVVLWGSANLGLRFLTLYKDKINITKIIDSDEKKHGTILQNIEINHPKDLNFKNQIVIVTCSAYSQIKSILEEKGLIEYKNLFYYDDFERIFKIYEQGKLISNRVDISLTEKCTLKCKKCNMFMPYFKEPKDQNLEDVKKDIKAYFNLVDYVKELNLLGGEPFIYPYFEKVVEYIGENFRDKIGKLVVFTNGMIIPQNSLVDVFKKYDVEFRISDYTEVINYRERINCFISILEENEIRYYVMKNEYWGDFGFPDNPNNICKEKLPDFFDKCKAPFRGLWNNKVYFCHLETSAIRANIFDDNKNDYFMLSDFSIETKKKFLEFDLGYNDLGYVNFCSVCRGCECVNNLLVPASIQM